MLSTSLVTLALAASTGEQPNSLSYFHRAVAENSSTFSLTQFPFHFLVLALPAPTFFDGTLVKRQNDGIEGLRSLAQRATAGQSNGQCRDQCGPWITVFSVSCAPFALNSLKRPLLWDHAEYSEL